MSKSRFSVGAKIYMIVLLSFLGFAAVISIQLRQLDRALEDQKRSEILHLAQVALQIVKDEYAAAQKGAQTTEQAQKRAAERVATLRYGEDDYFWINDLHPRMVMHPIKRELNGRDLSDFKDPDGKRLFVEFAAVTKRNGQGYVDYLWPKPGADRPQPKFSYVIGFEPWGWVIGTGVYVDDLRAQVWSSASLGVAIGIVVILTTAAFGVFMARSMSRAIRGVTSALDELAAGHAETSVTDTGRRDEIGDIVRTYLKLKSEIFLSIRLKQMVEGMPIGVMSADAARGWTIDYMNPAFKAIFAPVQHALPVPVEGMLGQSIDIFHKNPAHQRAILEDASRYPMSTKIRFADRTFGLNLSAIRDSEGRVTGAMVSWQDITKMQLIADRFEEQVQSVVGIVGNSSVELQQHASQMTGLAAQTEAQAIEGTEAAKSATTSVESVAASAQGLLSSISEIGRQVTQSNEIATQAVEDARRADKIMRSLDEAAQKIGQIVDLIGTIAGQTNLLALNATIEAARAGEAGRGFAVVASEVKSLATQTAKATEEIVSQVHAIQHSTNDAVESIGSISMVIEKLSSISSTIASAVEEQTSATQEIARNAQQTSAGTQGVLTTISEVSQATRQTGEASRGMLGSADRLMGQAETLKGAVEEFLVEIRAA
jgi:methyl-accepting chemotaxis protein